MSATTAIEERPAAVATAGLGGRRRLAVIGLGIAASVVAVYAATLATEAERAQAGVRAAVIAAWALAGAAIAHRRPSEPIGGILTAGSMLAALGSLGALEAPTAAGAVERIAAGLRWAGVTLVPVFGMHVVMGLPDGVVSRPGHRTALRVMYTLALVLGAGSWIVRPAPLWPAAALGAVGMFVAASASAGRYRRARGIERQRMQWFGWAVSVSAIAGVVLVAVRVLADWRPGPAALGVVLVPIPIALALASAQRSVARVDRMLAHTVAVGGLTGLIVGAYMMVVVGLGRSPHDDERSLLLLSMLAAATIALLYIPTKERLTLISNRIVYGELHAPDEVLRTFGSRLSRAVPMDELLLQMAESLRKTFALDAVEVWTGNGGSLERTVSYPERGPATMRIGPKEQPVVARAGVSGPAWLRIWLPGLLEGREGSMLRVAPIVHSGELLGLILVERGADDDQLGEENERVLTELSRQVGLALHNVHLDSALQETLNEVRKQADELRASRQRVVAAADAARHKIQRDLHDGAQQNVVALAVKAKLVATLVERDPAKAKEMLSQLSSEAQDAVQVLRDFAHGVYPPILADRGLVPALSSTAARAALPTVVDDRGAEPKRYPAEIEAAVYFCCLEALNNAGKHAGEGSTARIGLWEEQGALFFEVSDDGAGFDQAGKGLGAGFVNMSDRLGAVGGSITVGSAPGRGTTIAGRIPLG